jgi:hypothetical protein
MTKEKLQENPAIIGMSPTSASDGRPKASAFMVLKRAHELAQKEGKTDKKGNVQVTAKHIAVARDLLLKSIGEEVDLTEGYDDTLDGDDIGFKMTAKEKEAGKARQRRNRAIDLAKKATTVHKGTYGQAVIDHQDEHPANEPEKHPKFAGASDAMTAFGLVRRDTPSTKAAKVVSHGVTTKQVAATNHQALIDRINRTPKGKRADLMKRLPKELHHMVEEVDLEEQFSSYEGKEAGKKWEAEAKNRGLRLSKDNHTITAYNEKTKHVVGVFHVKDQTGYIIHESVQLDEMAMASKKNAKGQKIEWHNVGGKHMVSVDGMPAHNGFVDHKQAASIYKQHLGEETLWLNIVKESNYVYTYTITTTDDEVLNHGIGINESSCEKQADRFLASMNEKAALQEGVIDTVKGAIKRYQRLSK